MKLLSVLTAACSLLLFSNCKHDCDLHEPLPVEGHIQFDQMAIGQKSRYIGLQGNEYYSNNNTNFAYSDDTLQLEIIAQDANGFLVEETLKYVGTVYSNLNFDKDSVYHYYLKRSNDTLRIQPVNGAFANSRIFNYPITVYGLPMADYSNFKMELSGWKTSLDYCECLRTGFVENYTLFGQNYPRLNVIIENTPMSFDGNGQTMVYSKENGMVRFSTYSWWSQTGIGWDLIP